MLDQPKYKQILIAEDDPEDQEFLRYAIQSLGLPYPYCFFQNGQEILDFLQHWQPEPGRSPRPALVLLDLKMPRKDGYQVLAELRLDPRWSHLPIIILTGSNNEEDIQRSYTLGADGYFVKPFDYNQLREIVRTVCAYWLIYALPRSCSRPAAPHPGFLN